MEANGHGGRKVLKRIEAAGDVQVERSLVGVVNARDVSIRQAAAGPVMASGEVSITNGGCGPMLAGADVTITNGGCGPLIARGDVSITNGGTQSVMAGGGVTLGGRSFVGVVLSPRVDVQDGARVLMTVRQAAALGVACGLMCALVRRALKR